MLHSLEAKWDANFWLHIYDDWSFLVPFELTKSIWIFKKYLIDTDMFWVSYRFVSICLVWWKYSALLCTNIDAHVSGFTLEIFCWKTFYKEDSSFLGDFFEGNQTPQAFIPTSLLQNSPLDGWDVSGYLSDTEKLVFCPSGRWLLHVKKRHASKMSWNVKKGM